MKTCKKCNITKESSDYYSHIKKGKGNQKWKYLDSYCKKCRLNYSFTRSINVKLKSIEYLGGKCQDCGLIDLPCVFDFHHLDPAKKEIAFGSRGGKSFERLKSELDKCVLLCANCHRKRHQNELFIQN